MVNFIPVKCPQCNADLSIEEGRETAFCTYCGTKIIIDNENKKEYTYRYIDEAELRQTETEHDIRMKTVQADVWNLKITYTADMAAFRKTIDSYFFEKE